ncbi:MAG TPA: hypothetical protein VG756_19645 [Pseudonocardiaceae bacterium]|jgi:hypothetical protein|nr:hypothetical protein [Pseudonocardiaceae bacterium]
MTALITAVGFTWIGMVLAMSFLEAPLRFRAPGVTLAIGLGIGRLVFRALNAVEGLFAIVVVLTALLGGVPRPILATALVVAVLLVVQLGAVRPVLNRRSNAVLAGQDAPRSRAHFAYLGLEVLKLAGLIVLGVQALIG